MGKRTDILYDENERVSYLSTERVKNMLIEIDCYYKLRLQLRIYNTLPMVFIQKRIG